jgi:hypothetical protein
MQQAMRGSVVAITVVAITHPLVARGVGNCGCHADVSSCPLASIFAEVAFAAAGEELTECVMMAETLMEDDLLSSR